MSEEHRDAIHNSDVAISLRVRVENPSPSGLKKGNDDVDSLSTDLSKIEARVGECHSLNILIFVARRALMDT